MEDPMANDFDSAEPTDGGIWNEKLASIDDVGSSSNQQQDYSLSLGSPLGPSHDNDPYLEHRLRKNAADESPDDFPLSPSGNPHDSHEHSPIKPFVLGMVGRRAFQQPMNNNHSDHHDQPAQNSMTMLLDNNHRKEGTPSPCATGAHEGTLVPNSAIIAGQTLTCDVCGRQRRETTDCDNCTRCAWWWCRDCAMTICTRCNLMGGHTEHRGHVWTVDEVLTSCARALHDRTQYVNSRLGQRAQQWRDMLNAVADRIVDQLKSRADECNQLDLTVCRQIGDRSPTIKERLRQHSSMRRFSTDSSAGSMPGSPVMSARGSSSTLPRPPPQQSPLKMANLTLTEPPEEEKLDRLINMYDTIMGCDSGTSRDWRERSATRQARLKQVLDLQPRLLEDKDVADWLLSQCLASHENTPQHRRRALTTNGNGTPQRPLEVAVEVHNNGRRHDTNGNDLAGSDMIDSVYAPIKKSLMNGVMTSTPLSLNNGHPDVSHELDQFSFDQQDSGSTAGRPPPKVRLASDSSGRPPLPPSNGHNYSQLVRNGDGRQSQMSTASTSLRHPHSSSLVSLASQSATVDSYHFGAGYLTRPIDVCALDPQTLAVSDSCAGVYIVSAQGDILHQLSPVEQGSSSSLCFIEHTRQLLVSVMLAAQRFIQVYNVDSVSYEPTPAVRFALPTQPAVDHTRTRWLGATRQSGYLYVVAGDNCQSAIWVSTSQKQWRLVLRVPNSRYQYVQVVEERADANILLTCDALNQSVLLLTVGLDGTHLRSHNVSREYQLMDHIRSPTAARVDERGDLIVTDYASGKVWVLRVHAYVQNPDRAARSRRPRLHTLADLGPQQTLGMCVTSTGWMFVCCWHKRVLHAVRYNKDLVPGVRHELNS